MNAVDATYSTRVCIRNLSTGRGRFASDGSLAGLVIPRNFNLICTSVSLVHTNFLAPSPQAHEISPAYSSMVKRGIQQSVKVAIVRPIPAIT
jgi:hypothetical protein